MPAARRLLPAMTAPRRRARPAGMGIWRALVIGRILTASTAWARWAKPRRAPRLSLSNVRHGRVPGQERAPEQSPEQRSVLCYAQGRPDDGERARCTVQAG